VAVAAIDAHAARMVRVTELDGLLYEVVLSGVIAGDIEHRDDRAHAETFAWHKYYLQSFSEVSSQMSFKISATPQDTSARSDHQVLSLLRIP
jgi:hypothetical protein